MGDEYAASRLPDLPNAGYASRRQKETTDAICFFMRNTERDRVLLLNIVVDGPAKWRKTASAAWKGLLIDAELLDSIYHYFEMQAGANPAEQLLILYGMMQQQQRESWDKRASTKRASQKALKQALSDLRREKRH